MSPVTFLKEVYEELLKVTWPTQQELTRLTVLVIVVSVIVGAFVGGVDLALVKLTELLVK